ncbi:MAG: DUF2621 family protein [Thermoplasmata archaeon]|nr:MAG: DUF2621 family protein [Thermoplasmata archaeon]
MAEEVKWNDDMKALYNKLMSNTPKMFRDMAIKTTTAKAEKNAVERGSEYVEVEDIARACLSEAPEIFKPQIINDLKREGIDAEKYL